MTKRQKVISSGLAVILLIVIGFVAMGVLSGMQPPPKEYNADKKLKAVKVKTVDYDTLTSSVRETGRIVSREIVELISEVPGKILKPDIPLKKGQSFREGDLIVRIYNEDSEYNLKARKSRFLHSIATMLPDFKIDFPDSYNKWKKFMDDIDLSKDIPELPEIKNSQEKVYLASRNILNDFFSIKSEEIRLKKYNIYAPFNGAYTDVYLEVGSVANMGSRIASMIRTDMLEMEVPLNTREARMINIGSPVKAISEDGEESWNGTVVRKSDFVDPKTQSVNVYVKLNPVGSNEIYRGMYFTAEFNNMIFKNVIEVPRNSVYNFNQVFVVKDGRLELRDVDIIMAKQNSYYINGVEEGADIVIQPLVNAGENTPVQIIREN
jgi:membrane fusion protein (multidrug efflux system)